MHFLSEQEKIQLKIQHKKERDKRVCDRIKAILLYDDGWSPQEIARVLLITDEAIRNHIEDYKISKKLQSESGGSNEKLSKEQSAEEIAKKFNIKKEEALSALPSDNIDIIWK